MKLLTVSAAQGIIKCHNLNGQWAAAVTSQVFRYFLALLDFSCQSVALLLNPVFICLFIFNFLFSSLFYSQILTSAHQFILVGMYRRC